MASAAGLTQRSEGQGYRVAVIAALVLVVMTPVGLILYQSFLDAPFFDKTARLSLEAYDYVLTDLRLWSGGGGCAIGRHAGLPAGAHGSQG